MRRSLLAAFAVSAFLIPTSASAQIDCAALLDSPLAEPEGYAEDCLGQAAAQPADDTLLGSGMGYKYNMSLMFGVRGLHNYVVNAFPTETFLGNPNDDVYFGWDWDAAGATLYAHNFFTNELGTVDPGTAAFAPIAAVTGLAAGDLITGIAIDPTTDDAYAITTSGIGTTLYSLDLGTAAATQIGSAGPIMMVDIAIDCAGRLVGHDISTDAFYDLDVATGAETLIGSHGLDANFAQGMDFDNATGTLYAAVYTLGGTYTYGDVDLATGAINPLTVDTPPGEWEIAIRNTCPSVQAIPTLGSPSLVGLALLLLAAGLLAMRRR